MVLLEPVGATSGSVDEPTSPRISFSTNFLDEDDDTDFICIIPNSPRPVSHHDHHRQAGESEKARARSASEFEFLSNDSTKETMTMTTADELFYEGKLLPCWQMQHSEKLNKISLKAENPEEGSKDNEANDNSNDNESRMRWFLDDDPSPRPPKCTVLWKELLRLRNKQHGSKLLTPSSSSSSSSPSGSVAAELVSSEEREKNIVGKAKKRLERTRSATMRIRPIVNVPICTQMKNNAALPPINVSLKKGRFMEW